MRWGCAKFRYEKFRDEAFQNEVKGFKLKPRALMRCGARKKSEALL